MIVIDAAGFVEHVEECAEPLSVICAARGRARPFRGTWRASKSCRASPAAAAARGEIRDKLGMEAFSIEAAALAELRRAAQWYDDRVPGLGAALVTAVDHALHEIARAPLR